MIRLSPSLLEIEQELENKTSVIKDMLACGAYALHIDVMEPPFVPETKFKIDRFKALFEAFPNARYDIHIMSDEPDKYVVALNEVIPEEKRKGVLITIHIEAFRHKVAPDMGDVLSKEADFMYIWNKELKEIDAKAKEHVLKALEMIRAYDYKAGLAVEPATSLDNITTEMKNKVSLILLMSVISGFGGQKYWASVTNKIKQARQMFPNVEIQVDGGLNQSTISTVLKAGANNLVVGSYITKSEDPLQKTREILEQIDDFRLDQ